jgi:gluconokinase
MKLSEARDPLVLAIDIGSTASRARVYDATGTPIRGLRHRLPHQFTTAADGTAVIDPDQTLAEVIALITTLTETRRLGERIQGVAMDTFASSLVGVDADGMPLTPCYTYADARPAVQVADLRATMDETAVQQRTGCRFSTSYLPARLRWLRATDPDLTGRVARWLSLGEYIYGRLTGRYAASYSTAAWTGLLDRCAGAWDSVLIEACGASPVQFSPLCDATEPLDDVGARVAQHWPALARAVWFPAIADGYASNVGSGAVDETTMALSAATSGAVRVLVERVPERVPPGLWCYRVDRQHSLLGGALNDVGRVLAWLRAHLRLPDVNSLDAALRAAPAGATPAVLPFLTGERSPGWAAGARAAFADVTSATTALDLARGAMEAVALRYALTVAQLADVAPRARRVVASGGVTQVVPGWLQIVADALARPVMRVAQKQATLRGTALIALDVLAPDGARAPVVTVETYEPVAERVGYYRDALTRQQALYRALVDGTEGSHTDQRAPAEPLLRAFQ